MLRYLRPLTGPFSDRYRQYLPLPTSTPRGSVSAQGGTSSSLTETTSSNSLAAWSKKASRGRRTLSWHVKLLVGLIALAYALHFTFRHFFFPPSGSSEQAWVESLSLLSQQLATASYPANTIPNLDSTTSSKLKVAEAFSVHQLFRDESPGVASREVMPIRAYDALSDQCIEEWVVHHRWSNACRATDLSDGLTFDAVWAWVNGSDPAQILARHAYRPASPINVDAAHRYADHNELLYSMRSLYKSFGPDAIGKMHIMASAYPLPHQTVQQLASQSHGGNVGSDMAFMAGQVPYWLNTSSLSNPAKIEVHHDAKYFRPMQRSGDETQLLARDVEAWRAKTIPSFNSLAVESQLFNLPRASSDQLVYLNDDFFTMVPNSVSDLTSPLFGTVIKSDTRLFSFYRPSERPFQRLFNPAGEEVGIKRATWILGRRFPMRSLPYITHHPRSLSLPLLKEAAQTFPDAFSNTTLARFRAQKEVPPSIQAFFLASWYIVERHREALLWTWVVAKWGGREGQLSQETKQVMWAELAGDQGQSDADVLEVQRPVRKSREQDVDAFDAAGVPAPKNTEYSFSSQDGYALAYLDWSWPWERSRTGYPDLSEDEGVRKHARSWFATDRATSTVCRLSYSKCFAPQQGSESADVVFKRIAFGSATCGDCIIAALLNASGRSGISAFLPPASAVVRVAADFANLGSRAHLPLTDQWTHTDFSLSTTLPPPPSAEHDGASQLISVRTWCTRLIQRYQYVLGATPSTFYKVEYAARLPGQLGAVDATLATQQPTTFVCLNDDIKESSQGTQKVNRIMEDWFNAHWPNQLPQEV